MKLQELRIQPLAIPFRQAFHHAGASRAQTEAVLVEACTAKHAGYGEGCPRSYVTGESMAGALEFFAQHKNAVLGMGSLAALKEFINQFTIAIDENPAAWCAIELALLDLLAREQGVPVEALLGLPAATHSLHYSAVLGTGSIEAFARQLGQYTAGGFTQFKIKLSGDAAQDAARLALLQRAGLAPTQVRADANRLWQSADEAIAYLQALSFPFWAIEDPLRSYDVESLQRLAQACSCMIILDEYVLRAEQLDALPRNEMPWILNLRVSKMGGVLRSLEIIRYAKALGIPILIGAQVGETSILTRAGILAAHAVGKELLAVEGAFGTVLLERDIAQPSLMFGQGGMLDASAVRTHPGWGLEIACALS